MSPTLQRDADLVARASAGEDRAFRELVRQYTPLLFNHVYRLTQNSELADEMTQEVFVKVYRNLKSFEHGKPLKPWLMRIASNTTISELRKRARLVSLDAMAEDGTWEPAQTQDASSNTAELVEDRLSSAEVLAAIGRLDVKYRQVLLLRYREEFSYEEIAQAMAVPLNTVRTWLKRGRELLRHEVKEILTS